MREDEAARAQQEQLAAKNREAALARQSTQRRGAMSAQELEAEDAHTATAAFRALLDAERAQKKYKPGSAFDQHRADFMKRALTWADTGLRAQAALALRASYKFTEWPSKKERKQEVKQWLTQLDGQA